MSALGMVCENRYYIKFHGERCIEFLLCSHTGQTRIKVKGLRYCFCQSPRTWHRYV